jgi:ribosomal protein L22
MAVAAPDKQRVRAQAKWVRTSARKARLVTDHIRGRTVPEARTVLAFTPRAAAREVEKVLASAVANAEANHGLVGDELVIASAVVDEGPTLKRWRARARGRVARIRKRTCHITVLLAPQEGLGVTAAPSKRRPAAPSQDVTPVEEPPAAEEQPKPRRARAAKPKAEQKTDEKPKRATRKKKES